MFDLPTDLPADLVPLSWLIGVWEGTGVLDYTAGDSRFTGEFSHRVSFSQDGGDYLNYSAHAWLLNAPEDSSAAGEEPSRTALVAETGYWRLSRPATDNDPGPALLPPLAPPVRRTADDVESLRNADGGFDVEVLLAHSDGIGELYLGQVRGPRIDLASDYVARPSGAKAYAAASRMYGLVDGHLLWAWDIAALGQELASHASARLARAD